MTTTFNDTLNRLYRKPTAKPSRPHWEDAVSKIGSTTTKTAKPTADSGFQALTPLLDRLFATSSPSAIPKKIGSLVDAYCKYREWAAECEPLMPKASTSIKGGTECQCGNKSGSGCECRVPLAPAWRESDIPHGTPELSAPCILLGYVVVFDVPFVLDGRLQQMAAGSFKSYLAGDWKCKAQFMHNPIDVLSTRGIGLSLAEDSHGLLVALNVTDVKARQVASLVRRGDVNCMSLGWCIDSTEPRYRLGQQMREFNRVRFGEVSFVTKGANPAAACSALCPLDSPRIDLESERRLMREERRLERESPSWAMEALAKARRERTLCRLNRFGRYLSDAGVFSAPDSLRRKIIEQTMARMD